MAKDQLLVKTSKGLVRGFSMMSPSGKQVDAFFGIPFAQPPLEDLRFRPPIPIEPWDGTFRFDYCLLVPYFVRVSLIFEKSE